MKKYILMLAVAAATALVACGNKEAAQEEAAPVDSIEVVEDAIEEVVDTVAGDTVVAEVAEVAE